MTLHPGLKIYFLRLNQQFREPEICAPRYAPVIYGLSNTFGQISGFMAPQTTGLLLRDDNSHDNWVLAFWVSALVYLPGFLAFQLLSTDRVQSWALELESTQKEADKVPQSKSSKAEDTAKKLLIS